MWSVDLEPEVVEWIDSRTNKEFAAVLPHIERLGDRGSQMRMPASRSLGGGLLELRFDLQRVAWRITYYFAADRRIVLLTVFRKQRQNERAEVQRARRAMERCIAEGHTAEEDDR
jgi:phage-related protein